MTTSAGAHLSVDNWRRPERVRQSFSQMEAFLPTTPILRGTGPVAPLTPALVPLEDLVVPATGGTVGDVISNTETDAWLVLRGDHVVAERYVHPMTASTRHLLMSVSKSIVSTVVGALVDRGVLDPQEQVTTYVPELSDSGYEGARLRDVLDMRAGVRFSEGYLDPLTEVSLLDEAVGWAPRVHDGPDTLKAFLRGLVAERPHGGFFEYRSCETDVLGWICEAVTGRRFAGVASDLVWCRLGAEEDASLCVDAEGTGMFDGGVAATLRDLARFGALIRDGGLSLAGEQVIDRAWIDDLFAGGAEVTAAFAAGPHADLLPGGSYRGQFWVPVGGNVVLCVGIHGQLVYVDRAAGMVGVKLSSWPVPTDPDRMGQTLDMFAVIANCLADLHPRRDTVPDPPS